MKFRNYKKEDKSELKKIIAQYWTDEEFLLEVENSLTNNQYEFYVVEDSNNIVGFGGTKKISPHFVSYVKTDNPIELYILSSKEKNKGVGSFLLKELLNLLKERGFTEILCYSPNTHKDSWIFYENFGFSKCGIIEDPEDGYPGMLWRKEIK